MAVIVQGWAPDTCGCDFEFTYDTDGATDQLPEFNSVLRACGEHAGLSGLSLFDACVGENRRKNGVLQIIQQSEPAFLEQDYNWCFDGLRVLLVKVPLSDTDKTTLQGAVDARFGTGLVAIS